MSKITKNIKVLVTSSYESVTAQNIIFKHGIRWGSGDNKPLYLSDEHTILSFCEKGGIPHDLSLSMYKNSSPSNDAIKGAMSFNSFMKYIGVNKSFISVKRNKL
tara:strand:- start:7000 stop:7311 length:312 start_codon:yes stop_codon:yes gene_type:complete